MSLFGDLDLTDISDDPFAIPDNVYHCHVTGVKSAMTKADPSKNKTSKLGMTIEYSIADGDQKGKKFTEWKRIPEPADPKNMTDDEKRDATYLKKRLVDFGIPADMMNKVMPEDIIGASLDVKVVTEGGYVRVKNVTLHDDGPVSFK